MLLPGSGGGVGERVPAGIDARGLAEAGRKGCATTERTRLFAVTGWGVHPVAAGRGVACADAATVHGAEMNG
ncbi:hypothetical protein GCM10010399_63520 [Dactylosporangium fulvum]